jgi:hypothetical protein
MKDRWIRLGMADLIGEDYRVWKLRQRRQKRASIRQRQVRANANPQASVAQEAPDFGNSRPETDRSALSL